MWIPESRCATEFAHLCCLTALFLLAHGCSDVFPDPAEPPPAESARLVSAAARLELDVASLTLTLRQGDQLRAHLPLAELRLGTVGTFDPDRNYAPDSLKNFPVKDLSWSHPTAARLLRPADNKPALGAWNDASAALVELQTATEEGGAGPRWVLRLGALTDGTFSLDLELADGELRAATAAETGPDVTVLVDLAVAVTASERLYGLGEVFAGPEHRGQVRPMHMLPDLSTESGYNEVHVPIPLVIGSGGWGLFVQSRRPATFDLGKNDPERVHAIFNAGQLRCYLFAADSPLAITGAYTRVTGAPALPARWAFGSIIWRNENKDQAEVLDDMTQIRAHDLAISAMWLDRPFDTHVNNFDFDPKRFPAPDEMISQVQALGMRMAMWSTPYAEEGGTYHQQVVDNGWYVQLPALVKGIVKWGGPIDLTHPDAYAMWRSAIAKVAKRGIEGWKLDFAEDVQIGFGSLRLHYGFADGSDERTMHHGYALPYHKVYQENLPESGGFILSRAGTYGDQAITTMIWPGDLDANLLAHGECDDEACHVGGLPASVAAMLGLAASGYPLYAADTGGYRHGRPDKQTFMRWLAQTGLSAAQQIGGGKQSNPWDFQAYEGSQFDEEVLAAAVYYTRLHSRLFPYIYSAALRAQAHEPGPIRPFAMAHPELVQDAGYDSVAQTQYYLGDNLLVAPVVDAKPGREVLLPAGQWLDWWTHKPVAGAAATARRMQLTVPLDRIALWLRAGGLVPMLRPTIDTLAPATTPGVDSFANEVGPLHVIVGPGAAGEAAVYDGSTITLIDGPQAPALTVKIVPGNEFSHGSELEVWMSAPAAVHVDGKSLAKGDPASCLTCWWMDGPGATLHVRLTAGAHEVKIDRQLP